MDAAHSGRNRLCCTAENMPARSSPLITLDGTRIGWDPPTPGVKRKNRVTSRGLGRSAAARPMRSIDDGSSRALRSQESKIPQALRQVERRPSPCAGWPEADPRLTLIEKLRPMLDGPIDVQVSEIERVISTAT